MKNFQIYLKDGQILSFDFNSFVVKIKEKQLVIHDSENDTAHDVFISFDTVAAIVTDDQISKRIKSRFLVYLKNHQNPIEVAAETFEVVPNEPVKFAYSPHGSLRLLTDVYVVSDEVTAIFPANGLDRRKSIASEEE
jgi:hypothetical protein